MFDVFYSGTRPNLFSHEQSATDIEHARTLSRTRYFWWINYLSDYSGFDFLWEPVPWQGHQRHAWASQWQKDAGTYLIPKTGFTDTTYHDTPIITRLNNLEEWAIPNGAKDWDYSWHPDPSDPPLIYQFGTQWQKTGGPCYIVPNATEIKYLAYPRMIKTTVDKCWIIPEGIDIDLFDWTWHPDATDPPLIYQFGTQWQKTGGPCYVISDAAEIKYVSSPRATKVSVDNCWQIPSSSIQESFDWTWHPDTTDPPYQYQFGTQHQRTGGPCYTMPGATDLKFVDQLRIRANRTASAIFEIDHLDNNAGKIPNILKTVRYFDNYFDVLKRIAKSTEEEFIWICSSVCDYTGFDFSWHPEQWQAGMLHVFASDSEKFGDTFFMHVPTFRYRSEKCQLLEWYDLNFITTSVPRWPMPVIQHTNDTHVEAVKTQSWPGPLALFTTTNISNSLPIVPLWREKTKTVVPLDPGAESVIIPRSAIPYIKTQVYDYPYIDRSYRNSVCSHPQDIVFISYDEPNADANWQRLYSKFPRAHRIHGVAGMELALEAAADVATTPWYFAVFAKTQLHENFNFDFVPDRMQQPKHYIFNAKNTVNGLEYGHMGVILYNIAGIKQINADGNFGIDYTLSFAHEAVPVLSCYGSFDQSSYHTWRTAFRESAKLAFFESIAPSVEGAYRLNVWRTRAQGNYAEWCLKGANDGVEFFNSSDHELDTLKQSFKWTWLRQYFVSRYGELD